ncbi:MAG: hypothetical protein QOK14_226 [Frankiaceae bacterium]|nr:hypothetical protein [Frankiaceae bacterium]
MSDQHGPGEEPDAPALRDLFDSVATPPSILSAPRAAIYRKAARLRRRRAAASAAAIAAIVAVVAIAPSAFVSRRSPPVGSPPASSDSVATPSPTSSQPDASLPQRTCADPGAGDAQITIHRSDGVALSGEVYGRGTLGLVLGHSVAEGADSCEWYPYAQWLVHLGYVVLTVDTPGFGLSVGTYDDNLELNFIAGAEELRRLGVTSVVLGGSSLAGDGALVAAAAHPAGVVGVFALSPSKTFHVDVVAAARQLEVPALFVVAKNDMSMATDSRILAAATPKNLSTLAVVPGSQHGVYMLLDQTRAPLPAAVAVEQLLSVAFAR